MSDLTYVISMKAYIIYLWSFVKKTNPMRHFLILGDFYKFEFFFVWKGMASINDEYYVMFFFFFSLDIVLVFY
jgi:hypothetical protein